MAKKIQHENVVNYHEHFVNSSKKHAPTMPDYFKDELTLLEKHYCEFILVYKSRTNAGSETKTAIGSKKEWVTAADETLKRTSLYLKSMLSDVEFKTYLPAGKLTAKKDKDRLALLKRIMTTSEMRNHKDLADKKEKIEKLIEHGEDIFSTDSAVKTENREEVQKLNEAKEKWVDQFQKLKFLYRGYFYNTNIDYAIFFKDMQEIKKGREKEDEYLK